MKTRMIKTLICATAVTLAGSITAGAVAGPLEETQVTVDADGASTLRVPYVASELATDEGRQEIYQRISRAARQVCGPSNAHAAGGLRIAAQNQRCYEEAVDIAVGQLGASQVASVAN